MSEAAKLSLSAKGPQNRHFISDDDTGSPFNQDSVRFSKFRKFHKTDFIIPNNPDSTWPFGRSVKIQYSPRNMGDLLTNMWIYIKKPEHTASVQSYVYQNANTRGARRYIANGMIKSVSMYVDDQLIETITDEWEYIYDNLISSRPEKDANFMLQTMPNYGYGIANTFIIPVHFFFSKSSLGKTNPPFPLCAIHKQKLEFEIEFFKQEEWETNPSELYGLDKIGIITEQIKLTDEERLYWTSNPISQDILLVKKHTTYPTPYSEGRININLECRGKVNALYWYFLDKVYTGPFKHNSTFIVNKRTVQSGPYTYIYYELRPIMDKCNFTIETHQFPRTVLNESNHFRFFPEPMNTTNSSTAFRRSHAVYSYSFALDPLSLSETGNVNFNNIQSKHTNMNVIFNTGFIDWNEDPVGDISMFMYYTIRAQLEFSNGYVSLRY